MKTIGSLLIFSLFISFAEASIVRGYVNKHGKYVAAHFRKDLMTQPFKMRKVIRIKRHK